MWKRVCAWRYVPSPNQSRMWVVLLLLWWKAFTTDAQYRAWNPLQKCLKLGVLKSMKQIVVFVTKNCADLWVDGLTIFIYLWVLLATLQNGRSGSPDCGCRNSEDEGDEDVPADSRRITCRKCGNNHLWVSTEKTKPRARWCQVKFMSPSCILLMFVNQLHELVCILWFGTMPTSVISLCDPW